MLNEEEKKENEKDDQSEGSIKSDPETLHTTDPQEHMKGPISSLMHELGEGFEDKDIEKKKDEEKEAKDNKTS